MNILCDYHIDAYLYIFMRKRYIKWHFELERGALKLPLPVVRVQSLLGEDFQFTAPQKQYIESQSV